MGFFGRRKCQRCRTPLRAGSDACPYCGFDPGRAVPHRPDPEPVAYDAESARLIEDDIAPEAAPWQAAPERAPDLDRPKAAPARKAPWQTATDHPVADTVEGPWARPDMDETAPEAVPVAGDWGAHQIEETSLERMVRETPPAPPAKKPNKLVWLTFLFLFAMVMRFLFGA